MLLQILYVSCSFLLHSCTLATPIKLEVSNRGNRTTLATPIELEVSNRGDRTTLATPI